MARLNKERQDVLQPIRMQNAIDKIKALGYEVNIISESEISFVTDKIQGNKVNYFPYSGWATGKDIKDGRGLSKLLKQL